MDDRSGGLSRMWEHAVWQGTGGPTEAVVDAVATRESALLDRIYEAAAVPEKWDGVLQAVADGVGAKVCVFMSRSPLGVDWCASTRLRDTMADYVAQGWAADSSFVEPMMRELWPGFRTETDYRTPEEIALLPVHAEFLDRRGLASGMGTVIQGTGDAVLQMAVQGFATHDHAAEAVAAMDALRPHLARALSLTAMLRGRSQVVVDSLALAGVAAAVIGAEGRLRSANALFTERMGDRVAEVAGRLLFADTFLGERIAEALVRHRAGGGMVQSVALRTQPEGPGLAIHLLPIVGAARAACDSDGVLLVLADPANRNVPSADLLRLMFDMTPAEARLARLIGQGRTLEQAAAECGVRPSTARVHLKSVFAKTGFTRQSDLVAALLSLGGIA